ncbi:O-antigen ligase family protein [Moritella sp. 36]|uniref:O-antigen ligase family protein n=1 Tax=Moritella sp. 36 TaxID=2746233 RepID=UPI001BA57175|nr:O-antigen ligase family protein [Moritella sp. 36]QUM87904.1 O-antigen ligase family protein [Moritella sp. 36]
MNTTLNKSQSKWITTSTIGVILCALLLFLYPKGYILGTVILLVISITAGFYKKLTWHKNLTLLAITIIIFTIPHIISLIQASGDISSVKKAARGIPLLLVGAFLIRFKPKQKFVYASFSLSLIIAFIIMVNEQMTGFSRDNYAGFNINPLMIAIVAVMSFTLPNIHTNNIKLRILTYSGLILGATTIIMSESKGAFLALLTVLLIFLCMPSNLKRVSKKAYAGIICLLVLGSIAVMSIGTNNPLVSRVSDASRNFITHIENPNSDEKESSTSIRLELWKGALVLLSEKPIFGYGTFPAHKRMGELYDEGYLAKYMGKYTQTHFHSMYFQALGNRGLFGLSTVILLLLIPGYILLKHKLINPTYSLSGLLVIISYIVTGIADVSLSSTSASSTYFVLILLCVSQVSAYKVEAHPAKAK